jgi:hypothetical protein
MQSELLSFVDHLYEDLELWYPKLRLEEAGFRTVVASMTPGTFAGKHGYRADSMGCSGSTSTTPGSRSPPPESTR